MAYKIIQEIGNFKFISETHATFLLPQETLNESTWEPILFDTEVWLEDEWICNISGSDILNFVKDYFLSKVAIQPTEGTNIISYNGDTVLEKLKAQYRI